MDDEPLLLGEGEDFGLPWKLWLQHSPMQAGTPRLRLRLPAGGGGGSTPLRGGARLAGSRSCGVAERQRRLVHLTGEIGKQFKAVHVMFADGTTKEAVLLRRPDLPVNFYVVLVDRRPTKLVALLPFGGGEWVVIPCPRTCPAEPADPLTRADPSPWRRCA
jgi:hypothetical protein